MRYFASECPDGRIGIKGGGTRPTEAYFERVKGLEEAVDSAQKQLDDALAKRNNAK